MSTFTAKKLYILYIYNFFILIYITTIVYRIINIDFFEQQIYIYVLSVILDPVVTFGLIVETGIEMVLTSENKRNYDMAEMILKVFKDVTKRWKKAWYLCSSLNTRIVDRQVHIHSNFQDMLSL